MPTWLLEKIKLETELLRYAALAVLATGGGSFGALMTKLSGLQFALALSGIFASIAFLGVLYFQYVKIDHLIQKGAEDESE